MSIAENKTRTNITIEKDLKEKIEKLAKEDDRSFNNYLIKVLKEHVASKEL